VADHDSAQAPLEEEPMSAFDRFAQVFVSPTAAFQGLLSAERVRGVILWGLAILAIGWMFFTLVSTLNPEANETLRKKQLIPIERMHDAGKLDDKAYQASIEKVDQQNSTAGKVTNGVIVGVVLLPLCYLVIAVLVLVVARVLQPVSDPRLSYSKAFAVATIASIIPDTDRVVVAFVTYLTGRPAYGVDLTLVIDPGVDAFKMFLLGQINPFQWWWFAVMGIGISVISGAGRMKSIVTWATVWIVGGGVFMYLYQLVMHSLFGM
jgi:hypothetical protein